MQYWLSEFTGNGADAEGNEFRSILSETVRDTVITVDGRSFPTLVDGLCLVCVKDDGNYSNIKGVKPLPQTAKERADLDLVDLGETTELELAQAVAKRLMVKQWLGGDDLSSLDAVLSTAVITRLNQHKQFNVSSDLAKVSGREVLEQILPDLKTPIGKVRKAHKSGTFRDNFDGAGSNTNLESWTPSGGTAWTKVEGDSGKVLVSSSSERLIVGNVVNSNNPSAFHCDDQSSPDQYVQYVMQSDTNSFICNRMTDGDNYVGIRRNSGNAQLFKNVAGSFTSLGTGSTSLSGNPTLKLESDSSDDHTVYLDTGSGFSEEIAGVNETAGNTVSRQGVSGRHTGSLLGWADDFEAGVLSSGWTGGIIGVTNPSHVNGIAVANIASINNVN